MRKLKFILIGLALLLINSTCSKYDDGEIWDEINSLDKRVTAIENQLKSINANISSLSTLISTLENRRYVSNISELANGYSITFSDGSKLSIKDGEKGADGKDAPVMNVQFFNGRYYWTQTIDNIT